MVSIRPHFAVVRPSPTTVSYTVSTTSPHRSLTAHCLKWFSLALRGLLAVLTLLIIAAKYSDQAPPSLLALSRTLKPVPWLYVGIGCAVALVLVFRRFHIEESLLTLRALGIQTSTISPYYFLPATTRFIPTSQIRDIFIHEAFLGFEVRYYLAIVVEGESEVVVVFPKLLPGREILEQVWRGARECLYEPKT